MRFLNWLKRKWIANQIETRREFEEWVNSESRFIRGKK